MSRRAGTVVDPWLDALDALDVRLRAQADFLAGYGACPDGVWTPPPGPLPEAHRLRAELLLTESRALEERSTAMRHRVHAASGAGASSPYR
jgi:hypothetical protein